MLLEESRSISRLIGQENVSVTRLIFHIQSALRQKLSNAKTLSNRL